ncbi:hypothetical protein ABK040_008600 [Willaertia magna]
MKRNNEGHVVEENSNAMNVDDNNNNNTDTTTLGSVVQPFPTLTYREKKKQLGKDKPQFSRFPVRVRAHCNPLSDEFFDYPIKPSDVNWKEMYPKLQDNEKVEILDVGCAYGGLITSIAPIFPNTYILGAEIRKKVADFTQSRISALREGRALDETPQDKPKVETNHDFHNVWAIRSNAMKYLPNYFKKGQLKKILFMFPDPHFKKKNHRRRIISPTLLPEYAYLLEVGGMIYTITDVKELGDWMVQSFMDTLVPMGVFERVSQEDLDKDPIIPFIMSSSEDGQRTSEQKLGKHLAVFRKLK